MNNVINSKMESPESNGILMSEDENLNMAKTSKAQIRAVEKYMKKNIVQVKINLHKINDADVLEKLDQVPSKAGYLKRLVRDDITKDQDK